MSRAARIISETGVYHITFRGINRQNIFEESGDYEKMLEIIALVKEEKQFEIYAYCLMSNHVHLFIKEKMPGDIKKIMHKILTRYVVWFNLKYQRSGSLIGNRYNSEPIEDDSYYLSLMRYIHQNPVKAGLVEDIKKYKWSSYNDYLNLDDEMTDISFTLQILSEDVELALNTFVDFHSEIGTENFRTSGGKKQTNEQVKRRIKKITNGIDACEIAQLPRAERNDILLRLRNDGLKIGEIERATGISRGIISKVKKVQKQARP